ncbi:MAG: protein translocase subunit SecD [Sphingomonadaceae bacterium]|nr:protein translocase subunit SecD [Sphingomonadaceae bacterium]
MLDFPRWKILSIWIVLIGGVLLSLPTFIPASAIRFIPEKMRPPVNLGLDLAGGSHILLEADINDVRKERLDSMERSIREAMRGSPGAADDIAIGDMARSGNGISFMVRDASQIDSVRERLNNLTVGVGLTGQRSWSIEVRDTSRVVMTMTAAGLQQFITEAMAGARDIVERRVNALGTREPTIVLQGNDRIVVQVPGLEDPTALKDLLGQTARLEFRMLTDPATISPTDAAAGRAPVGSEVLPYANQPGAEVVQRQVMISGDQLVEARQDFDQISGMPVVSIRFNGAGATTFSRITRENVGKRFAMIVDGKILSAPSINEPINGGSAQISGGFTVESASTMAIALKSGALPVKLSVVEERTVGPDLGKESIAQGAIAGIGATLATLIFMLVVYGRFGVYANIALIFNILLIVGTMALTGSVLTLPGIAGFVLTIGAAVDANVLINERIREELRRGRRVIAAVETGYKEASRAIFDANITNVIAAAIMFVFGSGPIKGFAVVLTIGIVTSVFTAVTVSRMFVAGWLRRARPASLNI